MLTALSSKCFIPFFMEPMLTFSFICGHGSLPAKHKNLMQVIVKACRTIGTIHDYIGIAELFHWGVCSACFHQCEDATCHHAEMAGSEGHFFLLPSAL